MISFTSDYIAGAHPSVLERLVQTNLENLPGYCKDNYCETAKKKIMDACNNKNADVYFLVGGTQTNQVVIDTVLSPYEGVICAKTGHINVHEAGAIEYSGHKVIALDCTEGKINANQIDDCMKTFYGDESHEHMVFPGMVYLSYPTEYGSLYSKKELENIKDICTKYDIPLFIDGARLAYGLCSKESDVTLEDLSKLADIFYIGGTKAGALCGEAVVFTHNNAPKHFHTMIKQHGALLAKGRLLGVQFDALFTDGLYYEIGNHAIAMAEKMKAIFHRKNYQFYYESPTNQQFIILDNDKMGELAQNINFDFWEKLDKNRTVVRFATSWSTTEEDLQKLDELL